MFCRHCGRNITDDSEFCPFCGKSVAKDENNNGKRRFCSYCGKGIESKTKKCPECGKLLFPIKTVLVFAILTVLATAVVSIVVLYFVPGVQRQNIPGDNGRNRDRTESQHVHNYNEISEKVDATCDTDGYIIWRCQCGETNKEVINAAHSYTSATCTEPERCTVCGAIGSDALGHDTSCAFCPRCNTRLFETEVYSGSGPGNVTGINLPKGKYNVILTHSGRSNFIVHSGSDNDSYRDAIWVNEIGDVSYVCQIESGKQIGYFSQLFKNGYINITNADGDWTITIEAIE